MISSSDDSSLASRLMARPNLKVEGYMQIAFLTSAASLCLPVFVTVGLISNHLLETQISNFQTFQKLFFNLVFEPPCVLCLIAHLLLAYLQARW
jgi:hypothetical protein